MLAFVLFTNKNEMIKKKDGHEFNYKLGLNVFESATDRWLLNGKLSLFESNNINSGLLIE